MAHIILWWAVFTAAMAICAEIGFRASRAARGGPGPQDEEASDIVMSAALALMGLLIAFAFGMAANHYEDRRVLVVAEADAIGTTYLRQQLLPEPQRGQFAALMHDYVIDRRTAIVGGVDPTRIAEAQGRAAILQSRIWSLTAEAIDTPKGAQIVVPLLASTNEMFDSAERQQAGYENRIPVRSIRVLLILAAFTAGLVGVSLAAHRTRGRRIASTLLFALIALAMTVVQDLDSPNAGQIHTPHQAMDRLAAMVSNPPAPADMTSGRP